MRRDELMELLAAQASDTDVRVSIAGYLLDVEDVDFSVRRDAIVLCLHKDDICDVIGYAARQKAYRKGRMRNEIEEWD